MTNLLRLLTLILASFSLGHATTVIFNQKLNPLEPPMVYLNGTYNGFAHATVEGDSGHLLICNDKQHTTNMPSGSLQYQVSFVGGPDPLHGARFLADPNNPTEPEKDRYRAAAILVAGLLAAGPGASAATVTDYQYALWNLFTPAVALTTVQITLQAAAVAMIDSPLIQNIYAHTRVYTPTSPSIGNQEFMEYTVPEPGYAALLLIAIPLGWHLRRRRRAA